VLADRLEPLSLRLTGTADLLPLRGA